MASKKESTPGLGIVSAKRQIFTYSENKLLDQITTEIMEAWRNDLITMRSVQAKCTKAANNAEKASDLIEEHLPKLNKFINSEYYKFSISEIKNKIESLDLRQAEINKSIFELEKKLDFDYVKKLMTSIKTMQETIEIMNKRRWWHRFFKPKI